MTLPPDLQWRTQWRECQRPWKLATLALGIGLLLVGAELTPAPDWDAPISFIMGLLAYATAPWSLRVGLAVFHTKFGEGKVLAIEGTGDDARAQVNFPRHGTKWLALSVAKLTVVD